jgi:hypothetical protein
MLNPIELKNIALQKKFSTAAPDEVVVYEEEKVQGIIKDIEDHVTEFAANGSMSVEYKLDPQYTVHFMKYIASKFKTKHPKLFILMSDGEKMLTITWDGNNYV